MQLLVFSDLHAHNHRRYSRPLRPGVNTRLQVSLDVLREMREYALEKDVEHIIFAGDLFDTKSRVPMTVINHVWRELEQWSEAGLSLLMIPGNHDHAVRSGEEHGLVMFDGLKNIHVLSEPVNDIYWGVDHNLRVVAVPYRENLRAEWFKLPNNEEGLTTLCIAHGMVEDVTSDIPVKFPEDSKAPCGEWIRADWLKPFDFAIVGHVHIPKVQDIGDCRVLVPGQPYQFDWQDLGRHRGFWRCDLDKGEFKMHTVRAAPEFYDRKANAWNLNNWTRRPDCEIYRDTFERMIVLLKPESIETPDSVVAGCRDALYALGAQYVDVLPPEGVDEDVIAPRLPVTAADDPYDVLERALTMGLVDLKGQRPERMLELGKELLKGILEPSVEDEDSV